MCGELVTDVSGCLDSGKHGVKKVVIRIISNDTMANTDDNVHYDQILATVSAFIIVKVS